jgi:tetratricopeptide (TPR) repeat protein
LFHVQVHQEGLLHRLVDIAEHYIIIIIMDDNSSAHSAPPMRAFQGLILTKKHNVENSWKMRRRNSSATAPKTPIDPIEGLGELDDLDDLESDTHSELTDDELVVPDESAGLFDNLQRNWSFGDEGIWEQTCFAAFCSIFYDSDSNHPLPPPHRVVVTGLWANVVLPSLMNQEDSCKIPQLVAQDVWNKLTRVQYLREDEHNVVSLAHTIYKDFGLQIAESVDTMKWRHDFAQYLQSSLDGEQQLYFVQLYASQAIIPYWLSLGEVSKAASLLHSPSFISKEWSFMSKQENPLQITSRHVKLMELYLSKLPPSSAKWQEALGLYQGWHTLLQQEMEIRVNHQTNASETSSLGSQSSGGSSSRRTRRRKGSSNRHARNLDPMKQLVMGRALYVLSMSLHSVLTELPGNDAAMSVLWKRQAEYLTEAMHVYSNVQMQEDGEGVRLLDIQHLLSAATWLSLSSTCATLVECDIESSTDVKALAQLYEVCGALVGETDEMKCLNVAKTLLGASEFSKKSKMFHLVYLSIKAELHDALGRWYYGRQQYANARHPLEEATKVRRQAITVLKDAQSDSSTLLWWGSSHMTDGSDDASERVCQQLCLQVENIEEQTKQMEISLSQSLEYGALAFHACDLSMAAMSWLQEALILKTSNLGKMSLEVARLNSAMAVIHEDLSQWDAGLSRYRESLRIQMNAASQFSPDEWFVSQKELFKAILLTLGSMGSAYRMLGDTDNAVGCHWKISTMSKLHWDSLSRLSGNVSFWGFENHRKMATSLRPMPLPTFVLEEDRHCKTPSEGSPPQSIHMPKNLNENDEENAILFQAAQAYQTILSLFEDKACKESMDKVKEQRTSSSSLANSIAIEDVPLLLSASYRLGLIHIHFGDFRSAITALEYCLNSLWVIDPSSSESGSSSDDSSEEEDENDFSRKTQRRKRALKGIFGNVMDTVDDEAVYHALGICRAACGEHNQAIRFHLTALKCARRMYGVNSIRASEILYDAATSYWYMKDYDKAEEFWTASLQIRTRREFSNEDDMDDSTEGPSSEFGFEQGYNPEENAEILYNIAACRCAVGKYSDPRTLECLESAKRFYAARFQEDNAHIEVANCLFYLALVDFRRSKGDSTLLSSASINVNRATRIYRSLGYLSPKTGGGTVSYQRSSDPKCLLQAHVALLEASVAEALGRLHYAKDVYFSSLRFYRDLGDDRWEIYSAYVLNLLGRLNRKLQNDGAALANFQEALLIRKNFLGANHVTVGETLYNAADIHARMGTNDTAMQMYNEALRIQTVEEGRESPAVATTLLMIASIYIKQGYPELALDKLKACLDIRKHRVEVTGRASQVVSFWSGDLADDFLAMINEENTGKGTSHVRFNELLKDDLVQEEIALAVVLHCMGNVYVRLREYDDARDCYEQSLRLRRRHAISDATSADGTNIEVHVFDTLHNLGCLYELCKDHKSALKYFATSLKLKYIMFREKVPPAPAIMESTEENQQLVIYQGKGSLDSTYLAVTGTLSYAATLHRMGTIHHRLGNKEESLACLGAALRMQKHYLGMNHYAVANTLVDLASVLRRTEGKRDSARDCYKEAFDIRKLRRGGQANVGHVLYRIGQLHDADQDYVRAISFYYQAIQTYGRGYVNTVGRRLCRALLLRNKVGSAFQDDESEDDMFAKEGLRVRSIEETDEQIQSHFATIAGAIRDASHKRLTGSAEGIMLDLDVNAPDCWISLELYLLSLVEIMSYFGQHTMRQLEQAGADGMRTSADAITFQMLYLIQE